MDPTMFPEWIGPTRPDATDQGRRILATGPFAVDRNGDSTGVGGPLIAGEDQGVPTLDWSDGDRLHGLPVDGWARDGDMLVHPGEGYTIRPVRGTDALVWGHTGPPLTDGGAARYVAAALDLGRLDTLRQPA